MGLAQRGEGGRNTAADVLEGFAPFRSTPAHKSIDLVANILFAPLRASLLAHPASAEVVRVPRPTRQKKGAHNGDILHENRQGQRQIGIFARGADTPHPYAASSVLSVQSLREKNAALRIMVPDKKIGNLLI
jgi:hypothetical protein